MKSWLYSIKRAAVSCVGQCQLEQLAAFSGLAVPITRKQIIFTFWCHQPQHLECKFCFFTFGVTTFVEVVIIPTRWVNKCRDQRFHLRKGPTAIKEATSYQIIIYCNP